MLYNHIYTYTCPSIWPELEACRTGTQEATLSVLAPVAASTLRNQALILIWKNLIHDKLRDPTIKGLV